MFPDVIALSSGESKELRCQAVGPPDPEVYWTRESVRMRNSPSGILKIMNATHRDSGIYRCHAVNYLGHDVKTAKIRTQYIHLCLVMQLTIWSSDCFLFQLLPSWNFSITLLRQ